MSHALVITVNYKGWDSTIRFLTSISNIEHFDLAHVVIVENGSFDGSAEKLRPMVSQFTNVELLESCVNRGYFGGASWALQQYWSKGCRPDWVIVCNNDVLFNDHSFLSKLFQRDPEKVAVIAPAIIARHTGLDCNPFMVRRPSRLQLLRIWLWLSSYHLMWMKQLLSPYLRILRNRFKAQSSRSLSDKAKRIYGAHGSFFIFSRSYFDGGGYIDDGHFLYHEELCIAEICVKFGLLVVHDADLQVWHEGHRATGRRLDRAMHEYARTALQYAIKKYFRSTSARRPSEMDLRQPNENHGGLE